MSDAVPQVDAWFREAADEKDDNEEPEVKSCTTALTRLEREIIDVVSEHLGPLVLRSEAFESVRAEIGALLRRGVPPSQTKDRSTIGRAEIILGSWLFAVEKQGGDLDALAIAADVPELSLLLPKALQDVAVLAASETV